MSDLWTAVTVKVTGLGLIDPATGGLLPVVKRKLFRTERSLDGSGNSLTNITVFRPESPETIDYAGFGGKQFLTYTYIIAVVYPGNQDNLSNIDIYSEHRDSIRAAFEPPFTYPVLNVTGAFDMRVKPDVWLPRSMFAINYDYHAMGVMITATG